ncbi:MAG: hypothetical protein V1487_03550 [bacterium]
MLSKQDLKNIREIVEVVVEEKLETKLEEKLGEDYQGRLDRIENKVDMACKIAKDADEELTVTQAKVDGHEERIVALESNFATV